MGSRKDFWSTFGPLCIMVVISGTIVGILGAVGHDSFLIFIGWLLIVTPAVSSFVIAGVTEGWL